MASNSKNFDDKGESRGSRIRIPLGERNNTFHSDPINQEICCHVTNGSGRNLVLCIDGTSNQFGKKNTNVIELYNLLLKEDEHRQRTWYNSGIGTYARKSRKSLKYYRAALYHTIDLAVARGFERTVLDAYRWLSDNYETGDCIFLFGFSRGAFQVRVLSAMIDKVGLIHKGNERQIPFAYELYENRTSGVESDGKISNAERFKKAFCRKDVKVHFVGAWDTVSSIGIVRGNYLLPGTIEGMRHVCFFRHALALDERRVKFLPEYAYGGSTEPRKNTPKKWWQFWLSGKKARAHAVGGVDEAPKISNEETKLPQTLEVWFPGTHSEIGGGSVENSAMNSNRPPLRWMTLEARSVGLRTAVVGRGSSHKDQIKVKESLKGFWWLIELLPVKRLTYSRKKDGPQETRNPHLGSPRKIHEGQKIHSSLFVNGEPAKGKRYIPRARPFSAILSDDRYFWEHEVSEWIAHDFEDHVSELVQKFVEKPDNDLLQDLQQTVSWPQGRRAVSEKLYQSVADVLGKFDSDNDSKPDMKWELLKSTAILMSKGPDEPKHKHSFEIYTLMRELSSETSIDDHQVAEHFLKECITPYVTSHLNEYVDYLVKSFFDGPKSNDISHVLLHLTTPSADRQKVVCERLYRSVAGALEKSDPHYTVDKKWRLLKSTMEILSQSPDELKHTHSFKIRTLVRGMSTGGVLDAHQVADQFMAVCTFPYVTLRGHTESVMSAVFSPEGKCIASASTDKTIIIWDSEAGKQIGSFGIQRTKIGISCIAFSPDGKHIVLALKDSTIGIWNVETGMQVGKPFEGHTSRVWSVALSPDGTRVVSGSGDKTVRIWKFDTREQDGITLRGHTDDVTSVAFLPDGKHIVSGSDDATVRIWSVKTGAQVGKPFTGHTGRVWSVASSPDGKFVISGSSDGTVRIWELKTEKQIGEPLQGHTKLVNSVAFSADGKRIISGSWDETIRIWDSETGKQLGKPFKGRTPSPVYSVAFSPDGRRVVSGSDDKTIKIWDVEEPLQVDSET